MKDFEAIRKKVENEIDFEVSGGIEHRYEVRNYGDGDITIVLHARGAKILNELKERLERELGYKVEFSLEIELTTSEAEE